MALICKFCGKELSRGRNHLFVDLGRTSLVRSVADIVCNEGECLNAAGQLTRHHPDAPEWNGGIDYSGSTPLGKDWA
jgi:hypothetical protein